jgi:uncharacterized membrane protein
MNRYLMTFLISMVPVVELRGAIPVGIGLGIEPLTAAILSVIGNMIPVPFIILFIRSILSWLRKRSPRLNAWVTRLEEKTQIKAEKVQRYEKIGLLLFVAIPLPGTGAWTGALIAAMLDMRLKSAVPMIFLGILIAATIVTMLTIGIIRL